MYSASYSDPLNELSMKYIASSEVLGDSIGMVQDSTDDAAVPGLSRQSGLLGSRLWDALLAW